MKDSTCVSSYPHSMLNHQEMLYIISDLNYQYSVLTCNCRLRQTSAAPRCSEHTLDNSECAHEPAADLLTHTHTYTDSHDYY